MKSRDSKFIKVICSIRARLILFITVLMFLTTISSLLIFIPKAEEIVLQLNEKYIRDLAIECSDHINTISVFRNGEVSYEEYADVLKDVSLDGIESSYAYLVAKNGVMLYHPTKSKVGAKVENEVVTKLVSQLALGSNNIAQEDVVRYEYKGVMKYAGYKITDEYQDILVVTADEDELLARVNNIRNITRLVCAIIVVVVAALGILLTRSITKPMILLTRVVDKIAALDMTEDDILHELVKRRDETGDMSKSVENMKDSITTIVDSIRGVSVNIESNAEMLHGYADEINNDSTNNSATTEELAASMEESSSSVESISNSISSISSNTDIISNKSKESEELSLDIMGRAEDLKKSVVEASKRTAEIYKDIKQRTEEAIEKSKAVNNINILTNSIKEVASQTSLLSLNASIEAARAGEQGKGFAVVAGEIGKLAAQSSSTVADIVKVVDEVHAAVDNLADSLRKILAFIDTNVIADYDKFTEVGVQYSADAETFKSAMQEIYNAVRDLDTEMKGINRGAEEISVAVTEAATGVTDIADKTSDVVVLAGKTFEVVSSSNDYAKTLAGIVDKFKL